MLNRIDLSRADLNLLVLFEVVLSERHVGRAAGKLKLSPSAISHGLGRLRRLLNDPLFIRTPKGVVPTARATELAEPIADVLARARSVISTAEPFDAARSTRRFTIGASDAMSAVILPALLADVLRTAPRIDLSVRDMLGLATSVAELDARGVDLAITALDEIPVRFAEQVLFDEDFVIVSRAGHPFTDAPTLDRYCEMLHVIVSLTGGARGYVDDVLAAQGRSRRVALAVPSFMTALAVIAETDLVAAMPKKLVVMHAARFGVVATQAPLPLRRWQMRAIAPKAALMDTGLAWLFDLLGRTARTATAIHGQSQEV